MRSTWSCLSVRAAGSCPRVHPCVQQPVGFQSVHQAIKCASNAVAGTPQSVLCVSWPVASTQVDSIQDKTLALMEAVVAGTEIPKADAENLQKKRKLIRPE